MELLDALKLPAVLRGLGDTPIIILGRQAEITAPHALAAAGFCMAVGEQQVARALVNNGVMLA